MASPAEARALVAAFEDAFTRHLSARHAIPVGSGRLGLKLILEGLGIGPGDRVALPAFTDQSVPAAIRRAGAEPLFVDVDTRTYNLDPNRLEDSLTDDTRAVIATHIFGAPCDLETIEDIARRRDLVVIEDCAHAIDATRAGRRCGTVGTAAIFSFVVTKAVNAFGGGMVATGDDRLAAHVRTAVSKLPLPETAGLARRVAAGYALATATRPDVFAWLLRPAMRGLRAAGGDAIRAYDALVRPSTINAHVDRAFSPIQAAVGLAQLRDLPRTQAARGRAAGALRAALPSWLEPQGWSEADTHAWYFFVATAADPDDAARRLAAVGIDCGRRPMRNVSESSGFEGATFVQDHGLQLPIHPTLPSCTVDRMVEALGRL